MGNLSTLAHYISRIPRENKGRKIQYPRRSNVTLYSEQKHTHTHSTLVRSVSSSSSSSSLPTATREDEGKKKETHKSFFHRRRLALVFTHTHSSLFFFTFFNKYQKQTERREGGNNLRFHFFSATCFAKRLRFIYLCLYSLTHFYSVW